MGIKGIFLSVFLFCLIGCAPAVKPIIPLASQTTATDVSDAIAQSDFIKPCPMLPVVSGSSMAADAIVKLYIVLEGMYNDCAAKDDCLIAVVMGTGFCNQPIEKPKGVPGSGNESTSQP